MTKGAMATLVAMALLTAGLILMSPAVRSPAHAELKMRRDTLILHTATGAHRIEIEVAETEQQKMHGLMFRMSLPDNAGMLFPYSPPQEITMWMRNTFISLDMIFIRADGIVHRIEPNTEPHSETIIPSRGNVSAVLEMKAGSAARLGLKPGDRVEHSLFRAAVSR